MIQSYVIEEPEDLNEIDLDLLGDDFFIFVMIDGWISYYIRPNSNFYDTFDVYNSYNGYLASYGSIVVVVNAMYNGKKL